MSNDASLQINPEVLSAAARIIDNQRSIIENRLADVLSEVERLKDGWEGGSADSFRLAAGRFSGLQSVRRESASITDTLRAYVSELDMLAAQYMSAEQRSKAMGDALPGDVFVV